MNLFPGIPMHARAQAHQTVKRGRARSNLITNKIVSAKVYLIWSRVEGVPLGCRDTHTVASPGRDAIGVHTVAVHSSSTSASTTNLTDISNPRQSRSRKTTVPPWTAHHELMCKAQSLIRNGGFAILKQKLGHKDKVHHITRMHTTKQHVQTLALPRKPSLM